VCSLQAFAASTTTPVPRNDEGWQKRFQSMNERVKQGNVDLLFIGDSITHGWEGEGKDVWAKNYAPLNAVNLGIGGDRTEHVLWRLDNGNIDGIKPKAAVIMIGTNNGGDNSSEEIAEGITAIVNKLRQKLPETKILVLAIFPRNETPCDMRVKLAKASELASKCADNKMVFFLDIGKAFMQPDGKILKEIMPDFLHLSPAGYAIWAKEIETKLKEIMVQSPK